MSFRASAPGSLMLLGEYAVLHGKQAIVCAIDKRITVTLVPRQDKEVRLTSALGQLEISISHLKIMEPFQFVLGSLKTVKKYLRHGCDIQIDSEFSCQVGFASSAAVTVATLAALSQWLNLAWSETELIKHARHVIRCIQRLGSGADVAACVLGGTVAYRARPLSFEKLNCTQPITVIYSGSKTPTVDAVTYVQKKFLAWPRIFTLLCEAINHCSLSGIEAIKQQNWTELGAVMNIQQGLMDALGVNTPALNSIVERLREQPAILGAKISGSGLGDCVIGLGKSHLPANFQQIEVAITEQGVICEKI